MGPSIAMAGIGTLFSLALWNQPDRPHAATRWQVCGICVARMD